MKKILIIGCGISGSYLCNKIVKIFPDFEVYVVEKKIQFEKPTICGELIPKPELLTSKIPKVLEKYLIKTYQEIINRNVVVNEIKRLRLILSDKAYFECKFPTLVIDRSLFVKKLINEVESKVNIFLHHSVTKIWNSKLGYECIIRNLSNGYELKQFFNYVIGADSYPSIVDKCILNCENVPENDLVICLSTIAKYKDLSPDTVEIIIDYKLCPGGFAWIFPKDKEYANIGLGVRQSIINSSFEVLKYFEKFVKKFNLKPLTKVPFSKTLPVHKVLYKICQGNAFLIGDSLCSVIPVNGSGINTAMITADLLIESRFNCSEYTRFVHDVLSKYINYLWFLRNKLVDDILLNEKRFERFLKLSFLRPIVSYIVRNLMFGYVNFSSRVIYNTSKVLKLIV